MSGGSQVCSIPSPHGVHTQHAFCVLRPLANRVSPISTKKNQNRVDTARHRLELRQHRDAACMDFLEAYFLEYHMIYFRFLIEMLEFLGIRVWC